MTTTGCPSGAHRLFGSFAGAGSDGVPESLLGAEGRSLLCARLLEDGDAADLRWLSATLGREALAEWFDAHAGRLLSRRSRAFWSLVLERESPPAHPATAALWPL